MFEALQRTATMILNGPWDFPAQMNEIYQRRRDVLIEALRAIGLPAEKPKGGIYLWIPVPEGHTSTSFAELVLDQAGVVVTPGNGYGPAGEGFIRISLTVPDERIDEAVERIENSMKV
jgi:LL-diaminopimelate aminotransferase